LIENIGEDDKKQLAACGGSGTSGDTESDTEEMTLSSKDIADSKYIETYDPSLTADTYVPGGTENVDYEEYPFTFLNSHDIFSMYGYLDPDLTGDILDDTCYERNVEVEEEFNITISEEYQNYNTIATFAKNLILTDEDVYDAMYIPANMLTPVISENLFWDLKEIDALHMEQIWWDQPLITRNEIEGRLFYATSDLHLNAFEGVWCLYFNEDMMENLGLDSPYELALSGKWTYDKFYEYCKAATKVALDAFVSCTRMFTIVGHSGSSAYECVKKNGYEFIDIDTGKKLLEGTVELGIDPDIVFPWTRETADDCGTHWMDYKDVVEKVVIEGGIDKVTGGAFKDFTNLKYVQLGGQGEMDGNAFLNCTGLVSIYKAYDFPQEGVADLTGFKIINAGVLRNTGIHTVIIKDGIEKVNASGLYGVKNIISEPTEYLIGFCKDNGFNLISSKDPNVVYEYYRYIDAANIIQAGTNAMCSFDSETGVLTVFGEGETYDISNYYGGGSKKQPWFRFRKEIKKIVFGPKINKIGKYSFAQCVNLEVIELPDAPVEISNVAFEKCYNLKSVYRAGGEPIEGVFDLSKASALSSWGFAYNYLVVNPIISEEIIEMDSTLFEDCMNIANIYGVPGSYAESFAAELGKTFVDISTGMPAAATATPPEMNQDEKERAERDAEKTAENTEPLFTDPVFVDGPVTPDTGKTPAGSTDNGGSMTTVIIIAVVAVVVVAAAVVAVIVLKKKKKA